ncbi:hypothetical protein K1719_035624 [Acacia pycnantha]|nr:hypothetical protein K1719_035624 [Acacia pycnantha]
MKIEETVKLISAEGFEFVVDREAAMVSQAIHNMLTSPIIIFDGGISLTGSFAERRRGEVKMVRTEEMAKLEWNLQRMKMEKQQRSNDSLQLIRICWTIEWERVSNADASDLEPHGGLLTFCRDLAMILSCCYCCFCVEQQRSNDSLQLIRICWTIEWERVSNADASDLEPHGGLLTFCRDLAMILSCCYCCFCCGANYPERLKKAVTTPEDIVSRVASIFHYHFCPHIRSEKERIGQDEDRRKREAYRTEDLSLWSIEKQLWFHRRYITCSPLRSIRSSLPHR